MSMGLIAFHYPKPEFRIGLIQRIHRAAEVMAAVPGCLEIGCWQDEGTGAIVTTGRWESREAWEAAMDAVATASVDIAADERESRPREVFFLTPV